MTAGLAAQPRRSSISGWRAFARSKTTAGSFASQTAGSPRRSTPMAAFSGPCRGMSALPWICLSNGADVLHALRRLVRLALRPCFGYSVADELEAREINEADEVKKAEGKLLLGLAIRMILEDLQHRYESLKPRITLVRSYL